MFQLNKYEISSNIRISPCFLRGSTAKLKDAVQESMKGPDAGIIGAVFHNSESDAIKSKLRLCSHTVPPQSQQCSVEEYRETLALHPQKYVEQTH